jgi:hypothetical protein
MPSSRDARPSWSAPLVDDGSGEESPGPFAFGPGFAGVCAGARSAGFSVGAEMKRGVCLLARAVTDSLLVRRGRTAETFELTSAARVEVHLGQDQRLPVGGGQLGELRVEDGADPRLVEDGGHRPVEVVEGGSRVLLEEEGLLLDEVVSQRPLQRAGKLEAALQLGPA